ncbi:unnamed protein product [Mytilus coruscus]|uniref:Uncharacterized protein n=1 Tax=Mytilus coruscus TaxID=42192 RepID=A0A6J8E4Q4_MYTCO|nr:unnamed protein product [Mytilus coruscus]
MALPKLDRTLIMYQSALPKLAPNIQPRSPVLGTLMVSTSQPFLNWLPNIQPRSPVWEHLGTLLNWSKHTRSEPFLNWLQTYSQGSMCWEHSCPSLTGSKHTAKVSLAGNTHGKYQLALPKLAPNIQPRSPVLGTLMEEASLDTNIMASMCVRNGCINRSIENPGWDNEYCSTDCVVSHCRDVFTAWVANRQGMNFDSKVK